MTLDAEELGRVYDAHAAGVLRFFARRTLQVDVAIDLVAETFAQAFEHRRQFRGSGETELLAWIFGIARHQLSGYFRRGEVERRALDRLGISVSPLVEGDYERVEELADLQALRAAVRDSLADLSTEHREALRLRIVEERPYSEIASLIGVSEPTVRARVSRGLRALAKATKSPQGSAERV
jgi:RNA polymerase sigma factor (sigma-70 family)